uniref:Protein kinase n=1 Tax=Janibacter limosus TaxID=53458 RepID=A0AC61U2L2_9MICO|nr:protein kinase [Janibacter limosus]
MGEVFAGRYELLDLIGQGGMGSVWRVHDRRTDPVVAAKVLRQSDAASLLRFVRETAFRIQHPHVVTPLGWAGEDDRVLFTMPVVDGGSVATPVGDHGPLPAPFVAEILRRVLDGLGAVHASRVVHRDVKPANILLRATGGRPAARLPDGLRDRRRARRTASDPDRCRDRHAGVHGAGATAGRGHDRQRPLCPGRRRDRHAHRAAAAGRGRRWPP